MKRLLCILTLCLSLFGTMMAQQGTFAPQGAEWYFQVEHNSVPITQPSFGYLAYAVTGEAEILGHVCSVINNEYYVYEENNVVYWYNQLNDAFTVLYDFNAETGDTWYCDVAECTCLVTVTSVDSVTWNGHTYRTQYVEAWGDQSMPFFDGRIFEGIGYEKGLFPDERGCYLIFDGDDISYMRCYLENGEMLYHQGSYDCAYIPGVTGNCWDGTVANNFAGGDGTPENPYLISNGKQLALLAQQTNNGTGGDAYYKLTKSINLQKCTMGLTSWTSIGTPEHPFTGHFDGNNNYILNLYHRQTANYRGLFGFTDGAEIKNVMLALFEIGNASEYAGGLVAYAGRTNIMNCSIEESNIVCQAGIVGGLVGFAGLSYGEQGTSEETYTIANCTVKNMVRVEGNYSAGGIVGQINDTIASASYVLTNCARNTSSSMVMGFTYGGGLVGCVGEDPYRDNCQVYILNSYNRGKVSALAVGGIVGGNNNTRNCYVQNVYNTGEVLTEEPAPFGSIAFVQTATDHFSDCYWLDRENYSGVFHGEPLQNSCAFHPTSSPTEWQLDSVQYGTNDLLEALNYGAEAIMAQYPGLTQVRLWQAGTTNSDNGYPVLGNNTIYHSFFGSDWYYEILNDDGSVTYQYLECAGDTTINDEPVHIIVKINTLYDKELHDEITHEYIYEHDSKVYWWNKTLQEFTVLYDFGAKAGDEWEIKVGTESIVMHVDTVEQYVYENRVFKLLRVSDPGDIFSGDIVCGIGHLTSFFPERLMNKGFRVEGIRCFWKDGDLMFQQGNSDCDEIYEEYHTDVDKTDFVDGFRVYPNPTNGLLYVETRHGASLQEYRITNMMGQILMTGRIDDEKQQINVSVLPAGVYYLTVGDRTKKFVML